MLWIKYLSALARALWLLLDALAGSEYVGVDGVCLAGFSVGDKDLGDGDGMAKRCLVDFFTGEGDRAGGKGGDTITKGGFVVFFEADKNLTGDGDGLTKRCLVDFFIGDGDRTGDVDDRAGDEGGDATTEGCFDDCFVEDKNLTGDGDGVIKRCLDDDLTTGDGDRVGDEVGDEVGDVMTEICVLGRLTGDEEFVEHCER